MSITDELRKYAGELETAASRKSEHGFSPVAMKLTAIADHIDAEHEKAVTAAHSNGITEYGSIVAREYVKLPMDADGVPIRVGDVLTDGEYTFTVYELAVYGDGSWSIRNEGGNAWAACDVTHHHEPTIEDVLRELEGMRGNGADYETVVMRCAELAKTLRGLLANDGEGQQ